MKRLYIATPINSLKGDDLAEKKRKAQMTKSALGKEETAQVGLAIAILAISSLDIDE